MKVITLTNSTELEPWLAAWEDLWVKSRGSVFQHPGWVVPWVRRLMSGPMCWLAAGDDRALSCVLPMFPWTTDMGRTLSLIGQGVTDYLGELVDPESGAQAIRLLSRVLIARAGEYAAWDFQQLRAGSQLSAIAAPPDWSTALTPQQPCPVLSIPTGASSFQDVVPSGMAARVRRQRRRASQRGTLKSVVYDGARAREGLSILWELHQARWRSRGQSGVLDWEFEPFHRESVGWLGRRGIARIHVIELSGLPIAAMYSLSAHGETACYLQGISPDHKDLSPGNLVIAEVIDWAARSGMQVVDMLRGRESYKYEWGAQDRQTLRRVAQRGGLGTHADRP